MKLKAWRPLILVTLFGVVAGACSSNKSGDPVGPQNHNPVITMVTVAPGSLGPSDSAVVTCIASDPDGDTLVYDWDTDTRMRIRGAPPEYPVKTGTYNNAEWFYPNSTPTAPETAWVIVTVRDRRGGDALGGVNFLLTP
jgi:hypothetical protein